MNGNSKLSELLGILNSINFDEVINDLEIESLKRWTEMNENNKDPRFQEIIKKLNKVLQETILTAEEKREIVLITEQYYKFNDSFDSISELVGIIEGIVADNEINLKEVEKLKTWLNRNTQLLGTFFYDKLHIVVNNILKDNKLVEAEKQQLYILLMFLLKDNASNQKIDILKESVKQKEVIGNKLIELIGDSTIIKKIHKQAIMQMRTLINRNCSVYTIDCEIVFLSLTLIALLNYDSNFWDYVREEYEELYLKYNDQKIEGQIRNIINKYKTDNDPRIISYVLKNAIVPKPFLPSFFDFIYDIYRLNFGYSIDPSYDLYEEFSFVYDGIKKSMNYDDDDLVLNVTHKTYRLIKTTKELILDDNKVNSLIELSVAILKIIDNYYWTNNTTNFENEYYKYGFENWRVRSDKTIKESKNENSKLRSRWEPEFKLNGNQVSLSIPNHKIKNYYDYEQLRIQIYNGEELIYENDRLDVYDIIGGYRIEQNEDVKIDRPLKNVRYLLLCGDNIIYDSKEKLYRNYIFFNESGNELKNNRDYKGLAILCSEYEVEGMQKLYSGKDYVISYKNVNIGDYIKVGNNLFNFSTILIPGVIGQKKEGNVVINNHEQVIYSEVEGIVYESEKNFNNIAIVINGERHRMSDFEFEERRRGLYYNYFIKISLESGTYDVNVEEFEDGYCSNKNNFNFVVDKNFNFKVDPLNIEEFLITINYLNKNYVKVISLNEDDINKLSFDDENIGFIIPNGLRIYKLDDGKWFRLDDQNNYIWIDDISVYSNLRISGINFTSVQVKDEHYTLLTTLYPTTEKFYYDLTVGALRSYDSHNYIYLDFFNEDKKIGVLKIYCKCYINENLTNIYFDKDDCKYYGYISFYGKGNVIVRITDELGKIRYEQQIKNNDTVEIGTLKSFVNYKLEVVEKKLGFTLQTNNVLYSKNIKYYSFDDFEGRYFQIFSVDYDQMIMKKYVNKTRLLYNTYIEITERVGKTNFIGNVYIYKGEKKYIEKINPVEIEFASDPDSKGQILTYITNDGEMLFNDFAKHTILNDLDSYDAIPIYSYVINMERKR